MDLVPLTEIGFFRPYTNTAHPTHTCNALPIFSVTHNLIDRVFKVFLFTHQFKECRTLVSSQTYTILSTECGVNIKLKLLQELLLRFLTRVNLKRTVSIPDTLHKPITISFLTSHRTVDVRSTVVRVRSR